MVAGPYACLAEGGGLLNDVLVRGSGCTSWEPGVMQEDLEPAL